jgi:4-aminobutyrate aminotransferase
MELIVPGEGKTPNPEAAAAVLENSLQRGLLAYMAGLQGHPTRVMPPLNVATGQADEALTILDESFSAGSD